MSESSQPTIVFIHGAWHGAWAWSNYVEFFETKGFRCITFDLTGHGERPQGFFFRFAGLGRYMKDLKQILSGIKNPILMGHSTGGLLIQKYLASNKARAAVLVAPVPYNGIPFKNIIRKILDFKLEAFAMLLSLYSISEPRFSRHLFYLGDTDEKIVQANAARILPESPYTLWRISLSGKIRFWPYKRPADTPMLIVGAENDYYFPVKRLQQLADYYKADHKWFDHMPHNMVDAPGWENVAIHISEWLARLPAK